MFQLRDVYEAAIIAWLALADVRPEVGRCYARYVRHFFDEHGGVSDSATWLRANTSFFVIHDHHTVGGVHFDLLLTGESWAPSDEFRVGHLVNVRSILNEVDARLEAHMKRRAGMDMPLDTGDEPTMKRAKQLDTFTEGQPGPVILEGTAPGDHDTA